MSAFNPHRKTVHPFPARMAATVAFESLARLSGEKRVLDPMMGSGTTLVVARALGHKPIGFDTDPLAVLLARTWCRRINHSEYIRVAVEVLNEAKVSVSQVDDMNGYPNGADQATREFVDYWFDSVSRRQLRALADCIEMVDAQRLRETLWCAFSRMIITKSRGVSLAMDLSHSRPHRAFAVAPVLPFDAFLKAVEMVSVGCSENESTSRTARPIIRRADARKIPLPDHSVDAVVTSPPYLNAIDYVRCSKFSLVWMGHSVLDLRVLRSTNIGTEVSLEDYSSEIEGIVNDLGLDELPGRWGRVARRYIVDMAEVTSELSRVLKPGGHASFVVGDSTLRGVFVENSKIVSRVAENRGLELVDSASRDLPQNRRYLPPPELHNSGTRFGARMRQEVVLTFQKMD